MTSEQTFWPLSSLHKVFFFFLLGWIRIRKKWMRFHSPNLVIWTPWKAIEIYIHATKILRENPCNPHPRGPFWSLSSRGLIAIFGSWVRLRVRTNFWTLRARSCEVSSRVLELLSTYCTVYSAHTAFLCDLGSLKHISRFLRLWLSNF